MSADQKILPHSSINVMSNTSTSKNLCTIVVLELRGTSTKTDSSGLIRICASGIGRNLSKAEETLNNAIEASEYGLRNLEMLHRLRACRVFSQTTFHGSIAEVLRTIYSQIDSKKVSAPIDGLFQVSAEEAREAIVSGLQEFKDYQRKEKVAREKRIAANEMRRASAVKTAHALEPKKDILRQDIRKFVWNGEKHSQFLCGVLDGLEGKALRYWAERELRRQERNVREKIASSERLRKSIVERSTAINLDLVALRELRRNIKQFEKDSVILTECEESKLYDLHEREESFGQALQEWCDELPSNLIYFAELIVEAIENDRTEVFPTVKGLATELLLDQWDKSNEIEYREQTGC
jgi:hypothetical protein